MKVLGNFLNDFFSINETRKSTVTFVFLLFSGIGAYKSFVSGDLSDNMTTIILTLGGIIFGVNSIGNIIQGIKKKDNDFENDTFGV